MILVKNPEDKYYTSTEAVVGVARPFTSDFTSPENAQMDYLVYYKIPTTKEQEANMLKYIKLNEKNKYLSSTTYVAYILSAGGYKFTEFPMFPRELQRLLDKEVNKTYFKKEGNKMVVEPVEKVTNTNPETS